MRASRLLILSLSAAAVHNSDRNRLLEEAKPLVQRGEASDDRITGVSDVMYALKVRCRLLLISLDKRGQLRCEQSGRVFHDISSFDDGNKVHGEDAANGGWERRGCEVMLSFSRRML